MISEEPDLLQIRYGGDDVLRPWRVIVASILLQRARGKTAEPVLKTLLQVYPRPWDLWVASDEILIDVLQPLGLQRGRAKYLRAVSFGYFSWLGEEPDPDPNGPPVTLVATWKGVGNYVTEAYRMLVKGDLSFEPDDGKLRTWWDWRASS